MPEQDRELLDATEAYRRWDELYSAGLRMALSTESDDPAERAEAWRRLIRAHERTLAERDAAWQRIATRWQPECHVR